MTKAKKTGVVLNSIVLATFTTSCLPSQQPQIRAEKKNQNVTSDTADHPRDAGNLDIVENGNSQRSTPQEGSSDIPKSGNLTQGDILLLETVTIQGNGGLKENSPNFANRYTDPNGKPLNDPSSPLVLKVGQVLNVCNAESATAGLAIHTNFSPFPHGRNIPAGSCAEHRVRSTFNSNGNNMYDHNLGGRNGSRAYPIYIKVVSEAEAETIISNSAP